MTLQNDIELWDGKSKSAIQDVYVRYESRPDFEKQLVTMLAEPALQTGASWLLKHWFEARNGPLADNLRATIYRHAHLLARWEAQLHILQCAPWLPVPTAQLKDAELFLRHCMRSDTKFVRAWAYSGFHDLAGQYPAFRPEAISILGAALEDESAASVQARIRRKLKEGFPD